MQSGIRFPFLIVLLELRLKEVVDYDERVQVCDSLYEETRNYKHYHSFEHLCDIVSLLLKLNSWISLLDSDLADY